MTEKSMERRVMEYLDIFPDIDPTIIEKVITFADRERDSGYIYIFLKLIKELND